MRISVLFTLTATIFICSTHSSWTYAAPTSPISIPDDAQSQPRQQQQQQQQPRQQQQQQQQPQQPQPFSGIENTIKAVLVSAMDTIQDLNYGVALPESDQTDWSCVPSDEHPYPVILLHGLFAPAFKSWRIMARRLSDIGYCVYQLKYGMFPDFETLGGISDIRESAKELDTFITKVLATTHAQKVDLIGHSEGPVVARWYLKYLDRQGQEQEQQEQKQDGEVNIQDEQQQQQQHVRKEREGRVRSLVSIAPVGKGTSVNGILAMIKVLGIYESLAGIVQPYCAACVQILEGSDLLQQLYGQDGLQAEVEGVRYLNIVTSRDNVVTPFTNGVMTIPDESSKEVVKERQDTANKVQVNSSHPRPRSSSLLQNLVIENHCAYNSVHSDHCGIFQSPFAFHATNAFLSSDGLSSTLDTNNVIPCTLDPESDAS